MRIPNLVFSTAVLFISNLVVRVIGFLYKIFLSRSIGEVGLGIYHILFNFLMICLALTTTGIPTTLSCLVANKKALNDKHNSNVLFISTLYVAFFISLMISLIIAFNASFLSSKLLKDDNLSLLILSICPAIVLITISNILRGYYYGLKEVVVPAIGQVLEQLSRIFFVALIILFINNKSFNCYIALLGLSIGEAINILFIALCLYKNSNLYNTYVIKIKDFYNASIETIKMSIPITCNRMSNILLHSLSSMIVPSRLVLSGISYSQALSMYGVISGMVMPFIYLPFTLGSALIVNLIPSISQEMSLGRYKSIKKKINFAMLLTLGVGIFSSVFFYMFGEKLCLLVYDHELAGSYLKSMCLIPLFMSLNQTLSGILHSIRKEVISSLITIFSMCIQLFGVYLLTPLPNLNIYAYIYTTTFMSFFTCILHIFVIIKALKNFSKNIKS